MEDLEKMTVDGNGQWTLEKANRAAFKDNAIKESVADGERAKSFNERPAMNAGIQRRLNAITNRIESNRAPTQKSKEVQAAEAELENKKNIANKENEVRRKEAIGNVGSTGNVLNFKPKTKIRSTTEADSTTEPKDYSNIPAISGENPDAETKALLSDPEINQAALQQNLDAAHKQKQIVPLVNSTGASLREEERNDEYDKAVATVDPSYIKTSLTGDERKAALAGQKDKAVNALQSKGRDVKDMQTKNQGEIRANREVAQEADEDKIQLNRNTIPAQKETKPVEKPVQEAKPSQLAPKIQLPENLQEAGKKANRVQEPQKVAALSESDAKEKVRHDGLIDKLSQGQETPEIKNEVQKLYRDLREGRPIKPHQRDFLRNHDKVTTDLATKNAEHGSKLADQKKEDDLLQDKIAQDLKAKKDLSPEEKGFVEANRASTLESRDAELNATKEAKERQEAQDKADLENKQYEQRQRVGYNVPVVGEKLGEEGSAAKQKITPIDFSGTDKEIKPPQGKVSATPEVSPKHNAAAITSMLDKIKAENRKPTPEEFKIFTDYYTSLKKNTNKLDTLRKSLVELKTLFK